MLSALSYLRLLACMQNAYMQQTSATFAAPAFERAKGLAGVLGCEIGEVAVAASTFKPAVFGSMGSFSSVLKARGARWRTASRSYTFESWDDLGNALRAAMAHTGLDGRR